MPSFVYTNNISLHNKYGIMGDGSSTGIPTIEKFFPGGVVGCNVLAGGKASLYPATNAFPSVTDWTASFENYTGADYRLKIGSPVALAGCGGTTPGVDFSVLNAAMAGAAPPTEPEPPPPGGTGGNVAPIARHGGPYSAPLGQNVTVTGAASTDADGSISGYWWTWGDEVLVRAANLPSRPSPDTEWVREVSSSAAGGAALRNPNRGAPKRGTALAVARQLCGIPGAGSGGRAVPAVDADECQRQLVFERLAVRAVQRRHHLLRSAGRNRRATPSPSSSRKATAPASPGWGWNDDHYGGMGTPIYFAASGTQTIRIPGARGWGRGGI